MVLMSPTSVLTEKRRPRDPNKYVVYAFAVEIHHFLPTLGGQSRNFGKSASVFAKGGPERRTKVRQVEGAGSFLTCRIGSRLD